MDVVVSGSSGLIGTALKAALETAGHRVIPLSRSKGNAGALHWDPEGGDIDAGGLEGVHAVVHLAGEGIGNKRWNEEQKAKIRNSRVRGTALLAETLAKLARPPRVLLSGSGVGFYGNRGDEVLTETSRPGGGFLAELCTAWEAATAPATEAGIRVCHLRTGI
ncbi:MAG TPA: NAD-dependent epimerase/dehydratase family protein, partial [Pseudonocardiaceae bacterium]|nr:NAD-dependent epimerase/dehydratase family protein [Pseudonocardiaceae bacterium]